MIQCLKKYIFLCGLVQIIVGMFAQYMTCALYSSGASQCLF